MDHQKLIMTNGYIGEMGATWERPTSGTLETAIRGAMEMEGLSRSEVESALEKGETLKWCKSPNYYWDHSYGMIGSKRTLRCRKCGETGHSGQYPFSTLTRSGRCDDCV